MLNRRHFIAGSTAGLATLNAANVLAQGNVVRIVNGFPAGSSADSVCRLLSTHLASYAPTVIVENRAGAGGRLAVENVKNSPADGQSMLVTPDAMMILYPHTYKNLTYDPMKDFRAVTTLTTVPLAFAVGPKVPAAVKTLPAFAEWCQANPQEASFGTSGAGSPLHFTGVMLGRAAKVELTHVAYRGANLAAQDVAGGQIASCVAVLSDVMALALGGKLRLLGVTAPARSRFVPEVPTFREQGFGDIESQTWYGLFVPAKTPDARVVALHAAAVAAFTRPDVAEALGKFGMEPMTMPSEQLATRMKADSERWATVVKQVGYVSTE
jgi:tripartite-type tricarboxylate transporter receptor subunit TctC